MNLEENFTILLDIDGTIAIDSSSQVSPGVRAAAQKLARENAVYLLSNHDNPLRNRALASRLGLRYAETSCKKPSPRILEALPLEHRDQPRIVIGDKFTVDGLFARRIGARFIRVTRLVSRSDHWTTKWAYFLDDIVAGSWRFCRTVLCDKDAISFGKGAIEKKAP